MRHNKALQIPDCPDLRRISELQDVLRKVQSRARDLDMACRKEVYRVALTGGRGMRNRTVFADALERELERLRSLLDEAQTACAALRIGANEQHGKEGMVCA